MGLVPVTLLRDRRSSFVELYSHDNLGKTNYGTAGYPNLVGIPIGRMQGDCRFSFILHIRTDMLRKPPYYERPEPLTVVAAAADPQQ